MLCLTALTIHLVETPPCQNTVTVSDISQQLLDAVADALSAGSSLRIIGGNSKAFYGEVSAGERLAVAVLKM